MKKCSKCGEEKPLDEFYFYRRRQRYDSWCRACKSANMRKITKQRGPGYMRKARRNYHKFHQGAHGAVLRAIREGRRPVACEVCGVVPKDRSLHAHHPDYSEPDLIVWLCPRCHGKMRYEPELIPDRVPERDPQLEEAAHRNHRYRRLARKSLPVLEEQSEKLRQVWHKLGYRERMILKHRFEGETLEEVGRRFKVTRERVRQIEVCAIRRLQKLLGVEDSEKVLDTKSAGV